MSEPFTNDELRTRIDLANRIVFTSHDYFNSPRDGVAQGEILRETQARLAATFQELIDRREIGDEYDTRRTHAGRDNEG